MTWDEFYDKFYDWAPSTQIKKISQLSSFGSPEEVWEVAENLDDAAVATRFIKKALINDVHFTAKEIDQMIGCVDDEVVNRALQSAVLPFTEDQIYCLNGGVDAHILMDIAKKSGVAVNIGDFIEEPVPVETPSERKKRHRKEFWDGAAQVMMLDIFIDDFFGNGKKK